VDDPDTTGAGTGRPIDLAAIDGPKSIHLGRLFLARRDATLARNGIWHCAPPWPPGPTGRSRACSPAGGPAASSPAETVPAPRRRLRL
jgi:hypothetical protein